MCAWRCVRKLISSRWSSVPYQSTASHHSRNTTSTIEQTVTPPSIPGHPPRGVSRCTHIIYSTTTQTKGNAARRNRGLTAHPWSGSARPAGFLSSAYAFRLLRCTASQTTPQPLPATVCHHSEFYFGGRPSRPRGLGA